MFRRLPDLAPRAMVRVTIDGESVEAPATDSIAALLLTTGRAACRTSAVGGEPRGPYCLMGVCFDCLVEIDGVGNRQACMVRPLDGMAIRTMVGKREIGR
ncbi:MAG: (2Fe-2S)-binding protein [Rhodospirillales bacterium]|nr:(2Fe-2S)-binding protein [Rhodospirillales bacterium]QQS13255.1 MAG: (2Fe-2S)-binding protein [Rhodospirillales bacterium]